MPTRFLYIERKKEQTNLKIDEHVTLKAIQDDSAYPELFGRVAGIETDWPTALINARNPHSANSRTAFSVKGLEHAKAENFTLENIHISAAKPGRIQNTKHYDITDEELYEATRGVWKVGSRRENAKYAFAIFRGIIREIYSIKRWVPAGSTLHQTDVHKKNINRHILI